MNSFTCGLSGSPGTGKTYMSTLTLPDSCYPAMLVDVDHKADKMVVLQDHIKKGKIILRSITEPLVLGTFKERVESLTLKKESLVGKLKGKPKGYIQACDYLNEGMVLAEQGKVKTIILDSLTRLMEHQQRLIISLNQQGFMTLNSWGAVLTITEELIQTLLSAKANVIVNCHDKLVKDELTGHVEYKPLLSGQMQDKLGSFFEEMYVMKPSPKGQGVDYQVLTQSVGGLYSARTSRRLDKIEPADFKSILKKV